MWAPLPTSFLPLLVGFLIPPSELSLRAFVSGALPSKLLHFGYALGPRLLPNGVSEFTLTIQRSGDNK